tara:strand:- start:7006 stop:8034 length:1029 start_codon:yes stop_codon:yes gene_type:complete
MKSKSKYEPKNNKVIITMGDPYGIGPETILKALDSGLIPHDLSPIIIGSRSILEYTYLQLSKLGINNLKNPEELIIDDIPFNSKLNFGKIDKEAGEASFQYIKKALTYIRNKTSKAIVTGPISKYSWSLAGHKYQGQTELLAKLTNTDNFAMLFTAKSPITGWRFNTMLATTHIAINEISKTLNSELLERKLDLLLKFCLQFTKKPRIVIAGLNPHFGEQGLMGKEEINWINKVILGFQRKHVNAKIIGPLSPDSCWLKSSHAWQKSCKEPPDGILAMYHDQGLIPVKLIAFDFAVNTTIGLPFIRTSPDHGTGFDITLQGKANERSMLEAILTAHEFSGKG